MTRRVVVVLKRSAYTLWIEQEQDARIEKLIRDGDRSVRKLLPAHRDHEETVAEVERALQTLGVSAEFVYCSAQSAPLPEASLVVSVGGDGTLLTASHEVGPQTPLLGINSAPQFSVGFFCAGMKGGVLAVLDAALREQLPRLSLSRMEVLKGDVSLDRRVLNEALFCHATPAATSRYILQLRRRDGHEAEEEQKSSGVWIGPAAGSTAAQRSAGGVVLPLASTALQYVVREPCAPLGERIVMTQGLIEPDESFQIRNKMRQAKLFLDGEHIVHDVTIGDVLTFRVSNEPLTVLGLPKGDDRGTQP